MLIVKLDEREFFSRCLCSYCFCRMRTSKPGVGGAQVRGVKNLRGGIVHSPDMQGCIIFLVQQWGAEGSDVLSVLGVM